MIPAGGYRPTKYMSDSKNVFQGEYGLSNAPKNCSSRAESADSNSNYALELSYTAVFYKVSILQMNYLIILLIFSEQHFCRYIISS